MNRIGTAEEEKLVYALQLRCLNQLPMIAECLAVPDPSTHLYIPFRVAAALMPNHLSRRVIPGDHYQGMGLHMVVTDSAPPLLLDRNHASLRNGRVTLRTAFNCHPCERKQRIAVHS
jgi:hypothetical protein